MSEPAEPRLPGSIGVLICDDSEEMRQLLTEVIQMRAGMRVVGEARDGREAIAEARRLQPQVVLLDLSMPRMTGLEALPEIRLAARAARVIVLSGFAASVIAAEVLALGADCYLEKGASPRTITAAIERAMAAPRPDDADGGPSGG